MLVTLSHETFDSDIFLVNNTVNITSRGNLYLAFPMKITLPVDDGETAREVNITFDNVGLDLVESIRSITTPMSVVIDMVLASIPDQVQITLEDLKISNITYNKSTMSAKLFMDNFLDTSMNEEKYIPSLFPGIF